MAADWGDKYTGPLFRIKWRRVILDEGHLIKNPKARMSKAATELVAQRRWILTGNHFTIDNDFCALIQQELRLLMR